MAYVYVLNKKGQPLMPTTRCGKVNRLLKSGKAVVVNNKPFTIRLKYDTPNITQALYCGVDVGRENIGIGVSNEKGECVFLVEVSTSNKQVTKNMSERAAFRRERRRHKRIRKQRKAIKNNTTFQSGNEDTLRTKKKCLSKNISYPGMEEYITHKVMKGKEAKFNNRKREEHWLTPSARNLVQIHVNYPSSKANGLQSQWIKFIADSTQTAVKLSYTCSNNLLDCAFLPALTRCSTRDI